jgi:hypothetical protein
MIDLNNIVSRSFFLLFFQEFLEVSFIIKFLFSSWGIVCCISSFSGNEILNGFEIFSRAIALAIVAAVIVSYEPGNLRNSFDIKCFETELIVSTFFRAVDVSDSNILVGFF